MGNDKPALWFRILKSVVWYLWLALGPQFKKMILSLDAAAENNAHDDKTNGLHNDH